MPPRGYKMSPESRAKMSAAHKGRPLSEEAKAKLKGRVFSESHRAKLRGPKSEEAKARMREARQARPLREWVSYEAAHYRIRGELGSARLQICACGEQANEWAFQHDPVGEVFESPEGKPYSLNFEDYKPMCHSCHAKMDKNRVV